MDGARIVGALAMCTTMACRAPAQPAADATLDLGDQGREATSDGAADEPRAVTDSSAGMDAARDATADEPPDARSDGAIPCSLRASGPVVVARDGQVVEHLQITSLSGTALRIHGHAGVVVRDCEILHCHGPGIDFVNATGLRLVNVVVRHTCAPATGPLPGEQNNIQGLGSTGVVIDHVRLTRGSSGVYLDRCPGAQVRFVEGHDFRGPEDRGQLVQFNDCDGARLEDFSCENPQRSSWPEDVVSVFVSDDVVVRRGLVDGNNSVTGVGVMFEDSARGLCEDVDAVRQGNGCFSAYPGRSITFRRTRCRDNLCTSQGRGRPASGGLGWAGSEDSTHLRLEASSYHHLCADLVWSRPVFDVIELRDVDFPLRAPQRPVFCWEGSDR